MHIRTYIIVEPLLKDTLNRGHHRKYLSTKDHLEAPEIDYPMFVIHFSPLDGGQPLYSGQISWSQCVLYTEVSLYT